MKENNNIITFYSEELKNINIIITFIYYFTGANKSKELSLLYYSCCVSYEVVGNKQTVLSIHTKNT
jgi:hypothetical protein